MANKKMKKKMRYGMQRKFKKKNRKKAKDTRVSTGGNTRAASEWTVNMPVYTHLT